MYKKIKNMFHALSGGKKVSLISAFVLAGALVIMVPTLAWFSYQRGMGDMQYVDSPMELYITAGNGEDLSYLNLFDIKVTDPNKDCEYYVFGVCGTDATGYNLQLAYTTNNQFEYFIYPAKEVASTASYLVDYTAHNEDGSPGEVHYYAIDPDSIVTTGYTGNASLPASVLWNGSVVRGQINPGSVTSQFLNKVSGEIRANDTKHNDTYNYNRNKVQNYAEPLYWQAKNIKSGMNPTTKEVMDYYILEINWKATRDAKEAGGGKLLDDRETDILYIAVEATTVQ